MAFYKNMSDRWCGQPIAKPSIVAPVGKKARETRLETHRRIRGERLTDAEREFLRANVRYEGSPYHKRSPGDFGLTPPASPRRDATLCDEASILERAKADELLAGAITKGIVSESTAVGAFPKQMWVYDGEHVFEAMYGGSRTGAYHGYPIRRSDPLHDEIVAAWNA